MSESQQPAASKAPGYIAYNVRNDGYFAKIGAAWPNRDGKGFNIVLETLPVQFDGKITLRLPSEQE